MKQSKTAKKHRLRIIFDGVIAIGPPPQYETPRGLFGVMARSTRRQSKRSELCGGPPEYIPMHVPTFCTKLKPQRDARPPDQLFRLSPYHPTWYLWHPLRERLQFKFDDDDTPRELTYDQAFIASGKRGKRGRYTGRFGGTVNDGTLAIRSIHDLPNAAEIWPERCYLLPGMLDANADERVEAQVFVPWGDVCGGGHGKKGKGVKVKFEPSKPGGLEYPKVIVPNVIVTVYTERVEVVTHSLDTQKPLDSMVFRLTHDADILISNGDPSDVAVNVRELARQLTGREKAAAEKKIAKLPRSSMEYKVATRMIAPKDKVTLLSSGGGGYVVPPSVVANTYNRPTEVDIDFELFYSLLEGTDEGGLPIPTKIEGTYFPQGNCYGNIVYPPKPPGR